MAKLLLMCSQTSDLSRLLSACFPMHVQTAFNVPMDFASFDAFAILGGTQEAPPSLLPYVREALWTERQKGKKVFCEFALGAGEACFANTVVTTFDRPVCTDDGTVLDEQNNTRSPVQFLPKTAQVWYQYVTRPDGYRKAPVPLPQVWDAAIFEEKPGLVQCSFRMANFARARFVPFAAWKALLARIVKYLGGQWREDVADGLKAETYALAGRQSAWRAAERAARWLDNAGVLVRVEGVPQAVREGISSVILPDGTQRHAEQIRLDSMGEAALMYELRYQLFHCRQDRQRADQLYCTVRSMQLQEGVHRGMVRGSLGWWGNASYQDDASRGFLIPLAARAFLTGDMRDTPALRMALDYLLRTTGTDGLRVNQVNWQSSDSEEVMAARLEWRGEKWKNSGFYPTTCSALRENPANNPSGHYNGWYMAALLLCGMLLKEQRYIDAGRKGIATIMAQYPHTAREHSQTQEICRLILPLALLVKAMPSAGHAAWLQRLMDDLQKLEVKPGAFIEHDEGYTASCSHAKSGECSVFSHNGDPVADLLYSMNWLPVSLAAAWYATGSDAYAQIYRRTVAFLASIQLNSPHPILDGAWARAIDVESMEVHGVNNDYEWSTWAIEAGWTVAEIANGMLWGMYLGLLPRQDA